MDRVACHVSTAGCSLHAFMKPSTLKHSPRKFTRLDCEQSLLFPPFSARPTLPRSVHDHRGRGGGGAGGGGGGAGGEGTACSLLAIRDSAGTWLLTSRAWRDTHQISVIVLTLDRMIATCTVVT